jgi:hypothetical protein
MPIDVEKSRLEVRIEISNHSVGGPQLFAPALAGHGPQTKSGERFRR